MKGLCLKNFAFVNPRFSHSSSSVSADAMMRKRKSPGSTQSPCLMPANCPISHDILPIFNFTLMLLYNLLIALQNSWGLRIWKELLVEVRGAQC